MCKINSNINNEENIDLVIYSTILSLNKEFTILDIEKKLSKRNNVKNIKNNIKEVLNRLLEEGIIHNNLYYFCKMPNFQ